MLVAALVTPQVSISIIQTKELRPSPQLLKGRAAIPSQLIGPQRLLSQDKVSDVVNGARGSVLVVTNTPGPATNSQSSSGHLTIVFFYKDFHVMNRMQDMGCMRSAGGGVIAHDTDVETEAQRGKTLCLVTSTVRNEPQVLGFQLRADREVYTGRGETHGLHPLQGQDAFELFVLRFPKALKAGICC